MLKLNYFKILKSESDLVILLKHMPDLFAVFFISDVFEDILVHFFSIQIFDLLKSDCFRFDKVVL